MSGCAWYVSLVKLSPPLAVTGIIAASFAWMAWQNIPRAKKPSYAVVYYSDFEAGEIREPGWYCEDGTPATELPDGSKVLHCPQTLAGKTTP